MHKVHHFLGIMLTMFMLGSSSGIGMTPAEVTHDFDADETSEIVAATNEASGDTDSGMPPADQETGQPDIDIDDQPVPANDNPATEPDVDANPSTGPPADEINVDEELDMITEPAPAAPVEAVTGDKPDSGELADDTGATEEEGAEIIDVTGNDVSPDEGETLELDSASVSAQSATVTYTIQVLNWNTDAPIAGATVTVTDYQGDISFGTQTTNATGQVTFVLPVGDHTAHVSMSGFFAESKDFLIMDPAEWGDTDSNTIYLLPELGGTITIAILDRVTDEPVAGAMVAFTSSDGASLAHGLTNENGIYTSDVPLPGGTAYYQVSRDGYVSTGGSVYIEGDTVAYDHYLDPILAGDVTYTIYDFESDEPLSGVTVQIMQSNTELFRGVTDANGKVTFTNVPGGTYTTTVTLDGYMTREVGLYVQGNMPDERIAISPRIEAPGQITFNTLEQGSGDEISGVTVIVFNENDQEVDRGVSTNGVFISKELPFGVYSYEASKDGYHPEADSGLVNNGGITRSVIMRPVSTGTATVVIMDVNTDQPIANATVTVSHADLENDLVLTTNASGEVSFQATSFGYYSIEAEANGYNANSTLFQYDGSQTYSLYLRALEPGSATITVRDRDSNALLSGVAVEVRNWDTGTIVFSGTTNTNGQVTTPVLAEGFYDLTLARDGYFTPDNDLAIQGDVDRTYYLELEKFGPMTIHVLDQNDVPVAGATVTIATAVVDGSVWPPRWAVGNIIAQGPTGAQGQAVSPTLDPGTYIVMVEADGYEFYSRVVQVNGDMTVSVNLIPGSSGPTDPDPTNPDPTDPDPTNPDPTDPDPTNPDPTDPDPTNPDPTDPDPTNPDPTNPDPTNPDPTNPDPTNPDPTDPGIPGRTSVLTLAFGLCIDAECSDFDTAYDGYTVTWTVTPMNTSATNEVDNAKMAATTMIGSPIDPVALQMSQSFTISGVIQNGVAVAETENIPVGRYSVCLNPVITGPNGESVNVATAAVCSDVTLGSNGATTLPFGGVIGAVDAGDPVVTPTTPAPGGSEQPATPSDDAVAQAGGGGQSDQDVTGLPSTGTGQASGSNFGWTIASLAVLMLATLVFGVRRPARRAG